MNIHAPVLTARLEQMFADQAALTPDAPAIVFRGQVVRYGELGAAVERLAGDLAQAGVGPGVIVAIALPRTPALVAVLLAILKAGGAYLPLDPRNPPQRTLFMLSDSGCGLLVADRGAPVPEGFAGAVLELRDGRLVLRAPAPPPAPSAPAELAYLIYTSGSTGAPKGVMLGHGAAHLVEWARRTYSDEDLARVAATTSFCFDPSVFEIFVPLSTGGALILKENALERFAPDEAPSLMAAAPAVLAELCRAGALPRSLRVLISGGEALSGDLARQVFGRHPTLTLQNHYGPTETTTCATVGLVPRGLTGEPSIGRPVRDATVLLLDPHGDPVADGETGEIHIGGRGLALGYLNRPELTAERFVDGPAGRLYRTGDLGFWRDGELHFAGRGDQQVKIRGFRVELGEVESALMGIEHVERALALVREVRGRPRLVAYVQSPRPLAPAALRRRLAAWLPDYMLPSAVVVLTEFPRLVSGKVDRAALPEPPDAASGPADTLTGVEKAIVHTFEEVLARGAVGPDESFFDLGGDSLASVQAALRLGEILGHELPPALIHQAPTARRLARALEHGRTHPERHINLLEPGGPAPPLFCLADLFGHAFNYLSLARRLGGDRPVYGVTPGPLQEAFARDGDVAALTGGFVAELRRLRPHGPYLIAGYSSGGMLALDLACALESEGEEVRLVLLDSYLHARRALPRVLARWARRPAAGLAQGRRSRGRLRRILTPGAPPAWIPRAQLAFASRMIKAGAVYRPGRFSGPTLMVRADAAALLDQAFDHDGMMGWAEALAGAVAHAGVPGGHHEFLREPLVAATAGAVGRFLRDLDGPPGAA